MVLDDQSRPSDASAERSKSLLSKFSSPFAKRSAKQFEIEIEPEHPHKTYSPGELLNGQIVLTVFKGFDITHLTISLHGYVKVFKHERAPGDRGEVPDQLIAGRGTHDFEYHGNGFASLFEDEQALCGSGFLKKQVYKFGFQLQFPDRSLPGTLEFERGAVNYLISATVTRPTPLAPTTHKIYKVKFQNRIDVESMHTPKSRAIYLEPLRRRRVKKVNASNGTASDNARPTTLSRQNTQQSTTNSLARSTRSTVTSLSISTAPPRSGTTSTTRLHQEPPASPVPSERTIATHVSSSTQEFQQVERPSSQDRKRSDESQPRTSTTTASTQTISATTEISRHGVLPGDQIPVRVRVEHSKAVRGVVISTFYRIGRIDLLPPLPLKSKGKGKAKKAEYEDVYPPSKTGLGGLNFSRGAPNMEFRMDLTQVSNVMIVDPTTKMADLRFTVKVPDNAFPTVDNIPGGMISFTYHLEVVIDITGKLAESRLLPSLTNTGLSFTNGNPGGTSLTHDWANNILDTAPLRRTKNVACFELPVIIGTEDSGRKRRAQELAALKGKGPAHDEKQRPNSYHGSENGYSHWDPNAEYYGPEYYNDVWYDEAGNPVYDDWQYPAESSSALLPADSYYRPPPPPEEEETDEKARMRRREAALLESAPPDTEEATEASAPPPPIQLDNGMMVPANPHAIPITISRASARSGETIVPDPLTPPPSLPEDQSIRDDKQELERRRIVSQESGPDEAGPSTQASAPVINDEEEYLARTLRNSADETLPEYQR